MSDYKPELTIEEAVQRIDEGVDLLIHAVDRYNSMHPIPGTSNFVGPLGSAEREYLASLLAAILAEEFSIVPPLVATKPA